MMITTSKSRSYVPTPPYMSIMSIMGVQTIPDDGRLEMRGLVLGVWNSRRRGLIVRNYLYGFSCGKFGKMTPPPRDIIDANPY